MRSSSLYTIFSTLLLFLSKHIALQGVHKRQSPQQASEESIFRTKYHCYQFVYGRGSTFCLQGLSVKIFPLYIQSASPTNQRSLPSPSSIQANVGNIMLL
ncbi:hypothetical protein BDV29DRAFT_181557 [Aspergillus leporis]|uniref:Secreted protein n=1 Tax=Aspergillus leporis TaxID=41062 RepID=A0A5N5WSK1_9EURO|nr:hypothetical protein BDV29DRAFT_181557 [Aspergillus leporis]